MASSEVAPLTNGVLVRLVGRLRIRDGNLHLFLTALSTVFLPLLLSQLYRARRARKSWQQVALQLFSLGSPPSAGVVLANEQLAVEHISKRRLRFVCISDTHMRHEALDPLPPGDVLVHCGDFTNHGSLEEVVAFAAWFGSQPHQTKLVVPGNHDMILDRRYYEQFWGDWSKVRQSPEQAREAFRAQSIQLLVDESVDIDGITVHGSPWVTRYASWTTAFNKTDVEMCNHWRALPSGVDVLLTHMPPWGVGDIDAGGKHLGCPHLAKRLQELRPRFHVFGHVHTDFGVVHSSGMTSINASSVCDYYWVGCRRPIVFDA